MAMQMLFEVAALAAAPPEVVAGQSWNRYPTQHMDQYYSEEAAWAYALNQPHQPHPKVVITTRPLHRGSHISQVKDASGADREAAPHVTEKDTPPQLEKATSPNNNAPSQEHTHPYASVPDATYAPAPIRAAVPQAPVAQHNPAYNIAAKIHNPQIAKVVFKHMMEIPIMVTQQELLSLAFKVQAQVADVTIWKH